jgi:SAM-dependent methyltransferase
MVEQARRLNAETPNASFLVNAAPDLGQLEDASFDLVYSRIVLQHLPSRTHVFRYLEEFLRVVRPDGIVVFQLPGAVPFRHRLHLRRKAWTALRAIGVGALRLHRLGLSPIRVIGVPQDEIVRYITRSGGSIEWVEPDDAVTGLTSFQYYVVPANSPILAA